MYPTLFRHAINKAEQPSELNLQAYVHYYLAKTHRQGLQHTVVTTEDAVTRITIARTVHCLLCSDISVKAGDL